MPGPGFEPELLRPQRSVLTTRRSRLRCSGRRKSTQVNIAANGIGSVFSGRIAGAPRHPRLETEPTNVIEGEKSKIPLHCIAGTRFRTWVTAAAT